MAEMNKARTIFVAALIGYTAITCCGIGLQLPVMFVTALLFNRFEQVGLLQACATVFMAIPLLIYCGVLITFVPCVLYSLMLASILTCQYRIVQSLPLSLILSASYTIPVFLAAGYCCASSFDMPLVNSCYFFPCSLAAGMIGTICMRAYILKTIQSQLLPNSGAVTTTEAPIA
jgi:hypothetical protein